MILTLLFVPIFKIYFFNDIITLFKVIIKLLKFP